MVKAEPFLGGLPVIFSLSRHGIAPVALFTTGSAAFFGGSASFSVLTSAAMGGHGVWGLGDRRRSTRQGMALFSYFYDTGRQRIGRRPVSTPASRGGHGQQAFSIGVGNVNRMIELRRESESSLYCHCGE
ncbi:hypothetical protein QBC47DRAFT_5966 [Echria macrotheca]|uniref:Uncharacterized protein n=1 Tax=Echria macrotheca TaxID=438768 RepID=A0AAJ0BLG1_9PEZI|nr:hypothetical protein QBC47DRAFT_5966 [Echria macrotheca]